MGAPKTLVCDLGEVVIRLDFSKLLPVLSPQTGISTDAWLKMSNQWKLYDAYERGLVSSEDFHREVCAKTGVSLDWESFQSLWASVLLEEVPGVFDLIKRVALKIPVYALTNANALHYETMTQKFPSTRLFSEVFSSHLLVCRKPEPEIYQKVGVAIGLSGSDILFVDDRIENVEAARKFGWQAEAITPQSPNLKAVLEAYKLL